MDSYYNRRDTSESSSSIMRLLSTLPFIGTFGGGFTLILLLKEFATTPDEEYRSLYRLVAEVSIPLEDWEKESML